MKRLLPACVLILIFTSVCSAGETVPSVWIGDLWLEISPGEEVGFSGYIGFDGFHGGDHYLWNGVYEGVVIEFRVYDWASQVRAICENGGFEIVWQSDSKTGEFGFQWGWGVSDRSDTITADGGAAWCSSCDVPVGYNDCMHDVPPVDLPEWFFEELIVQLKVIVWQISAIAGLCLVWLGFKWGI